jgi:predicted nucleic acid-binding protein
MLVIDASLAVELALDRIGERASDDLDRGGELIAPPLLWSEVPSVLHEMSFRGEISDALAELALKRFLSGRLSINERRPDGHAAAAWAVAEEFGWSKTYDAEYVALAKSEGCRLVTLDSRMRRGADRLGFVVTPAELS